MNNNPECFLCRSNELIRLTYLKLNSKSVTRNLAYALPGSIANLLSKLSSKFEAAYQPVATNKKYFTGSAHYCRDCKTGCHRPFLSKAALGRYYQDFYWSHRDRVDGQHVPCEEGPNETMLALSQNRIDWIMQHQVVVNSVLDFGGGDCAAGYLFRKKQRLSAHVVDPSSKAAILAAEFGISHSDELSDAPTVDLIYSAHSIEHVHDILEVMALLVQKTRPGGHLFFETPNIGDPDIFRNLVHTPHTFMLSERSFRELESRFPVRIVAVEMCGPPWNRSDPGIQSNLRTDLRVLMRRMS